VAITNVAAAPANNTFGGTYYIDEGVLSFADTLALGPNALATAGGPTVQLNGGTIRLTAAYSSATNAQPWVVGPLGGTVDVASGISATKQGNSFTGTGPHHPRQPQRRHGHRHLRQPERHPT
jgi:hypothetical protein